MAFIARETSRLAVATQFALFTALASLPRVVSSSFSGMIVDSIGWTSFFYLSTLLAIPGLVLLFWVAPFNAKFQPQRLALPVAGSADSVTFERDTFTSQPSFLLAHAIAASWRDLQ